MNTLYTSWIKENYPTPESARLRCAEATAAMITKFPELSRVRGHVMVGSSLRPHWWCITSNDNIIDPTAHQWKIPPLLYYDIPVNAEEPHGKCYECGALLFRSKGDDSYYCVECN